LIGSAQPQQPLFCRPHQQQQRANICHQLREVSSSAIQQFFRCHFSCDSDATAGYSFFNHGLLAFGHELNLVQ